MNRAGWILGLLFWLCAAGIAGEPEAGAVDLKIRRAASAFMKTHNVPGMVIGVTQKGQERVYCFGIASRESNKPVTSTTLFELGSISKTFTVALAARAEAVGTLALSEPVKRYLPEMQDTPFGEVSLLALATHTAGGFPLQVPDEIQNNEQLLAWLKQWKPRYALGTRRTYANPSIGMLGLITARQMGEPFAQAAEKHIFRGLGLTHTYIHVPPDAQAEYAQGYNKKDEPVRLNPGVLADEAYGVKSSAKDMLRVVQCHMGDVKVEPLLKRALDATRIGYFQSGPFTQALIWEQFSWPVTLDRLLQGSSDEMVFTDTPVTKLDQPVSPAKGVMVTKTGATNGFGGYVAFVPSENVGLVILANRNHPTQARLTLAHEILTAMDGITLSAD